MARWQSLKEAVCDQLWELKVRLARQSYHAYENLWAHYWTPENMEQNQAEQWFGFSKNLYLLLLKLRQYISWKTRNETVWLRPPTAYWPAYFRMVNFQLLHLLRVCCTADVIQVIEHFPVKIGWTWRNP